MDDYNQCDDYLCYLIVICNPQNMKIQRKIIRVFFFLLSLFEGLFTSRILENKNHNDVFCPQIIVAISNRRIT